MTTEARIARARAVFALLALFALLTGAAGVCLLACAGLHEERRGDTVDVSGYPPEIQRAYHVFALRCSRCHTLARPLNARIHDPQHWIRYVQRMRRQPGSGIDQTNADLILTFLLYYHRQPEPPAQRAEPPAEPRAAETAPAPDPDPDPDPNPVPDPDPALLPPAEPPPAQGIAP